LPRSSFFRSVVSRLASSCSGGSIGIVDEMGVMLL
jgi:hypothetical protein